MYIYTYKHTNTHTHTHIHTYIYLRGTSCTAPSSNNTSTMPRREGAPSLPLPLRVHAEIIICAPGDALPPPSPPPFICPLSSVCDENDVFALSHLSPPSICPPLSRPSICPPPSVCDGSGERSVGESERTGWRGREREEDDKGDCARAGEREARGGGWSPSLDVLRMPASVEALLQPST